MNRAGILRVDKPEGPTSHQVVAAVRRAAQVRRVGHTGTLDPFASGLLVLCIGWATRLAEFVTALPKTYRGVIRLGVRTDTDDRTGSLISESEAWRELTVERVQHAIESQVGEIEQLPPTYSAKQVAGRRAYRLARGGRPAELKPVRVTVHRLSIVRFALPEVEVEIECSGGTYIRAVARDIGEALGVGAHLSSLRRLRVGGFDLADALRLEPEPTGAEIWSRLDPPESAVAHLGRVEVGRGGAESLRFGQALEAFERTGRPGEGPLAALAEGKLVAIVEAREGRLVPRKVFPVRYAEGNASRAGGG